MSRHLTALLFALGALFTLGCSDAFLAETEPGQPCASDDECGSSSFVCVIGVCVDPTAQALNEVLLEVRPPESSGYRPQQLPDPVELGSAGRQSIQLKSTVLLRGNVTDPTGAGVPSLVTAVPEAAIAGRALVVTAQAAGTAGDFTLALVEENTYRLVVQPQDPTRPPFFYASEQSIAPTPTGERRLSAIELPDPGLLDSVSGRVTSGEGTAMLGVEGMEVRVVAGGRSVSSVGRTLADGSFTVFLANVQTEDAYALEVRPTEANRLTPTVRVEELALGPGNTALGDIALGALGAPVPFTGVVLGPDSQPVPLASVHLSAELGAGTFSLVLNADEEGRYDAELRPGEYEVAVVAPSDNPSAGLVQGFLTTVDAESSPMLYLPGRVSASGTVLDDSGAPVANATVSLSRLGGVGGASEGVLDGLLWTFTATTDPQGTFVRAVDPGRYRLTVVPDPASNLPRDTRVIDIEDGDAELGELRLPATAIIAGTIQATNGAPIGMAVVSAFSSFAGGEGALELGTSLTGTDGAFEILLPDLAP